VHCVGADDNRARTIAEQRLRDEGAEGVPFMRTSEGGDGEFNTDNQHARAVFVLGEVFGLVKGCAAG